MHFLQVSVALFATANAFVPTAFAPSNFALKSSADEIDFDASVERLKAAGHLVRSGEGHDILDHKIVVDDESTRPRSKDGRLVDLDPLHKPMRSSAHSGAETDFDSPLYRMKAVGNVVRTSEGHFILDHKIVVDDESTRPRSKDGRLVDLDPLHKPMRSIAHSHADTDFDAPLYRMKAVGNVVRMGEGHDILDHKIVVDDESTRPRSKDGRLVDLDPLHKPMRSSAHSGAETDFDAPLYRMRAVGNVVRTGEGHDILDHKIVVEDADARRMDRNGEKVDMDPLHKPMRSIAHSHAYTDFDAPLYRMMAAGGVVRSGEGGTLDHDPVVDDECYLGKRGEFVDCVDFDSPVITRMLADSIISTDGHVAHMEADSSNLLTLTVDPSSPVAP